MTVAELPARVWVTVCAYADLLLERGACALVEGEQIALFRTFDGGVHAISNLDPFTGAHVLSRGIVGSRGEEPTVASPLHKQVFSLVTGECLDDPSVTVATYPTRVTDGRVEVGR
ncbi:nitrite reductase small subunit NirD [Nonomuraea africana]|uniref:Nitrite reductase (NADH) small subunit n=1 Tax=Nonomuraea africana TaxID=46171 RepID=A0ABR9KF72_9ACTN|nr:nitrite reductase small subunit NirD [Nonomuraea africana]MBE1560671.1 nitrite reductase (NADH) small subunit [Nonomuraea africana]